MPMKFAQHWAIHKISTTNAEQTSWTNRQINNRQTGYYDIETRIDLGWKFECVSFITNRNCSFMGGYNDDD